MSNVRIESITPEQMPILEAKAAEWAAIGLATGPMDVAEAREGIIAAYTAADLAPPSYYFYLKSPYAGAVGVFCLKEMFNVLSAMQAGEDRSQAGDDAALASYDQSSWLWRTMNEVWSQFMGQCTKQADGSYLDMEGDPLPNPSKTWPIIARHIHALIASSGMKWESSPIYGCHDAAWLAFYDALGELGIPETVAPMRGMMQVAKTAGWWWPLTDCVVVTERPTLLNRDEEGRLHSLSEAAIQYSDSWGLWSSHGVVVTQQIIEAPETLTTEQIIKETNAEVKRVMLEQYGFENFMKNTQAAKLDSSDFGTLWKADVGDDEPLVMVQVEDPSTDRVYMLRVPPTMTRAREAVAWTFNIPEKSYNPVIQT